MRAGQCGGKTSIKIAKVTIIQLQYKEAQWKIKESSHRHKSRKFQNAWGGCPNLEGGEEVTLKEM